MNITYSTTTIANISNNLTSNSNINIVINLVDNIFDISDGLEERKDYFLLLHMHRPRSPSISSSEYSEIIIYVSRGKVIGWMRISLSVPSAILRETKESGQ